MLAPLGITLGMAMPLGLSRLRRSTRGVPWAWGINGIASVVASAGAITVAIIAGFPAATLVALAAYLVALTWALVARWPQTPAGPSPAGADRARQEQAVAPVEH